MIWKHIELTELTVAKTFDFVEFPWKFLFPPSVCALPSKSMKDLQSPEDGLMKEAAAGAPKYCVLLPYVGLEFAPILLTRRRAGSLLTSMATGDGLEAELKISLLLREAFYYGPALLERLQSKTYPLKEPERNESVPLI